MDQPAARPDPSFTPPLSRARGNLVRWGLRLPILAAALLLAWHSLGDLDIWLHWRVGEDILAGHFPRTNTFTFTAAGAPWFDHEWLFQVLVTVAGKLGALLGRSGADPQALAAGWNVLRVILVLGLVALLIRPRRGGPVLTNAWALPAAVLGLGLLWPRMTIRPELVSFILLALAVPTVECCLRETAAPGRGWRRFVDPGGPCGRLTWLTWIWVQFHGFAVLVPVLLLAAGILFPLQSRLDGRRRPFPGRRWAEAIAACWVVLGLTPAGWRGWIYPVTVISQFTGHGPDLRGIVSELAPLARSPQSLALTILLFKVALIWGGVRILLAWPRPNLLRSLVFATAAAGAWFSARNLGFMAVAFLLLHRGSWGEPAASLRRILASPPLGRILGWVPVALMIVALAAWAPAIVRDDFYLHEGVGRRFGGGLTPALFPVEAARSLGRGGPARTFANLDAAAFVGARTRHPLFIDGRTELFPAVAWSTYNRIKRGGAQALADLDRQRVAAVCLAQGSGAADGLAATLLQSRDWSLAAAGAGGLLWRRGRAPATAAVGLLEQAAASTRDTARRAGASARAADLFAAASRLAVLAGNPGQATAILQEGLRRRPDHPVLLHNLGNREKDAGNYAGALGHFIAAVRTNPRQGGSALNAGVCAMHLGNPTGAAAWFRRAASIDPGDFQAWANLAVARMQSGDREGAVAALEKAVDLRPRDQQLRDRLKQLRGS